MKQLTLASIALMVGLVPCAALATDITVTGQGNFTQTPDTATLSATIQTNDPAAQRATSENNAAYDRFVAAMRGIGIGSDAITTTYYNLNYNPRPALSPGVIVEPGQRYGYVVERGVSVRLNTISAAGKAIDAAVAAGVTNVGGVSFGIANTRGAFNEALRRAVDDAQSQAQQIASDVHLRIVGIKSIQQGYAPGPMMQSATLRAAPATNIPPSDVNVSASITIVYLADSP